MRFSKKDEKNCKVYVKHFSGAKNDSMINYSKTSLQDDSDHFILHVGTNNLKSEKRPECIAELIIDLAVSLKIETREVSISTIIVRTDNQHLNE